MEEDRLISELEWFNRVTQTKRYEILEINWAKKYTRVIDTLSGEVYDVTAVMVGSKIWLKLHRLV